MEHLLNQIDTPFLPLLTYRWRSYPRPTGTVCFSSSQSVFPINYLVDNNNSPTNCKRRVTSYWLAGWLAEKRPSYSVGGVVCYSTGTRGFVPRLVAVSLRNGSENNIPMTRNESARMGYFAHSICALDLHSTHSHRQRRHSCRHPSTLITSSAGKYCKWQKDDFRVYVIAALYDYSDYLKTQRHEWRQCIGSSLNHLPEFPGLLVPLLCAESK